MNHLLKSQVIVVMLLNITLSNCDERSILFIFFGYSSILYLFFRMIVSRISNFFCVIRQEKSFPEIQFLKGSFLEIDWSEADVVYTSSICFSDVSLNNNKRDK